MENEEGGEKRNYELAVLLENETLENTAADFLSKNQLDVYQKEGPRHVNLAYPINKHVSAALVVYYFSALPELIAKFKEDLKMFPSVLRFLLITPPIAKAKKMNQVRESQPVAVDIKPPRTEAVSNEMLEETLEKILQ